MNYKLNENQIALLVEAFEREINRHIGFTSLTKDQKDEILGFASPFFDIALEPISDIDPSDFYWCVDGFEDICTDDQKQMLDEAKKYLAP